MPQVDKERKPPSGLSRILWRAPIWLYRLGLGGLFGNRLLLLHHVGRVSGKARENVLEIVNFEPATGTYYIAAGFGPNSDWFRNIQKQPNVSITIGRKTSPFLADILKPEESGKAMVEYARRHPRAAKELMSICGLRVDGSDEDFFLAGHDYVPFIALRPQE